MMHQPSASQEVAMHGTTISASACIQHYLTLFNLNCIFQHLILFCFIKYSKDNIYYFPFQGPLHHQYYVTNALQLISELRMFSTRYQNPECTKCMLTTTEPIDKNLILFGCQQLGGQGWYIGVCYIS